MRLTLALLALLAVLALPGCGGGDESPAPGGNEPTTTEKYFAQDVAP